jgi:WbqC-like protein family
MTLPPTHTVTEHGLVLSQPMFLPWLGIFEQARLGRRFIFYDDVQLPHGGGKGRSFVTRVQIKTARGVEWLSLPVLRAREGLQLISEARIAGNDWRKSHLGKIREAYKSAPHFEEIFETLVVPIYGFETEKLGAFCIHATNKIFGLLKLAPIIGVSSELGIARDSASSERVLAFCTHFGENRYISGLGAMRYMDYELFERSNVQIYYMKYNLGKYPQLHGEFTPFVSVLDPLFCVGPIGTARLLNSQAVYWKKWPIFELGRPVPQ